MLLALLRERVTRVRYHRRGAAHSRVTTLKGFFGGKGGREGKGTEKGVILCSEEEKIDDAFTVVMLGNVART